MAKDLFGAVEGIGEGFTGRAFAIPTKDKWLLPLDIREVQRYINRFKLEASTHPELQFFVTRIGCGYAKYKDEQIAPMFRGIADNCSMPEPWRKYLV